MVSLSKIKDAIHIGIGEYPAISKVVLFGSYASGEADDKSDVDVAITAGNSFTLFEMGGFQQTLEKELGIPVDVIEDNVLSSLHSEEIVVYEKEQR